MKAQDLSMWETRYNFLKLFLLSFIIYYFFFIHFFFDRFALCLAMRGFLMRGKDP